MGCFDINIPPSQFMNFHYNTPSNLYSWNQEMMFFLTKQEPTLPCMEWVYIRCRYSRNCIHSYIFFYWSFSRVYMLAHIASKVFQTFHPFKYPNSCKVLCVIIFCRNWSGLFLMIWNTLVKMTLALSKKYSVTRKWFSWGYHCMCNSIPTFHLSKIPGFTR